MGKHELLAILADLLLRLRDRHHVQQDLHRLLLRRMLRDTAALRHILLLTGSHMINNKSGKKY